MFDPRPSKLNLLALMRTAQLHHVCAMQFLLVDGRESSGQYHSAQGSENLTSTTVLPRVHPTENLQKTVVPPGDISVGYAPATTSYICGVIFFAIPSLPR